MAKNDVGHFQNNAEYNILVDTIGQTYMRGKRKLQKTIHREILITYWHIGKHIIVFEQEGSIKAEYGAALLKRLSKDLKRGVRQRF